MRVSHSWTPKLNILEILTHFWPASEPCRQATNKDMDFIFPVRTLPSLNCPPCKYEGMDVHSPPTVVCKLGDNFVEIWYFTCQNVLFWSRSIKQPDLQTAYGYRAESFSVDSNIIGPYSWAVTRSDLKRVSHSWTPQLNILEILKHFDRHRSRVDRQPLMIWSLWFLCLPCPPLPSTAVNMKAWTCKT